LIILNQQKFGEKFLEFCNGKNLDELCKINKIDRFSKISKKKYFNLFIEIAKQFAMDDEYQTEFLIAHALTR
jgi:hypothetical protein